MQPGLTRAVPLSILGFMLGALVVFVVRVLQNVEPAWDPGVGVTVAAFFTAWFFVWGMGAFDPKMSEHAHGPEDVHDEETAIVEHQADPGAEEAPVITLLGYSIWTVAFWTLVIVGVIALLVILPGSPALQTVNDNAGSALVPADVPVILLGGAEIQVNQFTLFLLFAAFTLVSLAVFGLLIALLFWFLSGGVTRAKATTPTPRDQTPPFFIRWAGNVAGWLGKILRPRRKQLN